MQSPVSRAQVTPAQGIDLRTSYHAPGRQAAVPKPAHRRHSEGLEADSRITPVWVRYAGSTLGLPPGAARPHEVRRWSTGWADFLTSRRPVVHAEAISSSIAPAPAHCRVVAR